MQHIGKLYWFSHWQDLKKDEGARARGMHGRAWLHLSWGDPDRTRRNLTVLNIEWHFFARQHSHGAMLSVGGGDTDRDVGISINLPYFGLYLGADGVLPFEFHNPGQKYPSERQLGFRLFDGSIWLSLWSDPDEWSSHKSWRDARSKVRQPTLHIVDWLLGKVRHSAKELRTEQATIPMPEGDYPVTLVFKEETWKRRWGRAKVLIRTHAEMGKPLPIPGKGENAWDIDDDAIYSSTFVASSVDEAIAHITASAFRDRERYGGRNWQPAN